MQNNLLKKLMLPVFILIGSIIYSQTVVGTVSDASGPVPGVNVLVKGGSSGAVTDLDGSYKISVNEGDIIVFSFMGFVTQEISYTGQSTINIVLKEDTALLEEVLVIGYGTVKKSDLTGSVGSVTADDFKEQPVTNLSQALQGRVAGVNVTRNSGAPGGNVKIRIRGANSMLGDNDPLYVVDGVALNIGIGDINVNDIESIEVLKDASSTAIYGSRGANGVIMITTKKGSKDRSVVQATVNIGISQIANKYDLMGAGEFSELVNTYRPDYFSQQEINEFKQNGGVDWQDEIFQLGISQDYQLSMSGGNEKTSFYVSGNFLDQTGVILESKQKKYSARANISSKMSDKFSFEFNSYVARIEALNNGDLGSKSNPVFGALIYSPTTPIYTDDNEWNISDVLASPSAKNPLMLLKERYDDFESNTFTVNTNLIYDITDDLKFNVILGADNNSYAPGGYQNEWINPAQTSAYLNENKSFTWQNSNILTYKKIINDSHDLTATGIFEQSQFNYRGFNANGSDIQPISVKYNNLGIAAGQTIGSYKSKTSMRSYVGRVSYKFMDRYLLTATYRADGTSKFQGDNKWGYFPSVGAAWRISQESFMENIDVISNLKLRGSWGVTGNQGISAYATIAKIGTTYSTFGLGSSYAGSTITGADNPDLKWETTSQINIGFDIAFYSGRWRLSADYYDKQTEDLLHGVTIPAYNGGGSINRNIGSMENKGFEIVISGVAIMNDNFNWNVDLNMASNKNKLLDLGPDDMLLGGNYAAGLTQESPFVIKVGESLGSFWGYKWQGVYSEAEASEASTYGFSPGDNKYLDYNDDDVIDSKDKHVIGGSLPTFTWGLSNSFRFGQFGVDVVLQGVHGNKVLNTAYAASATILSDATSITHVDGANYWTPVNQGATFANPNSSTGKNFIESTQFLQNGSYVKVQNLAFTYDLNTVEDADIKFSISGQNVLTFTKYKGFDPEASTSGNSDVDGGIDVGAYPTASTITFGVQASF